MLLLDTKMTFELLDVHRNTRFAGDEVLPHHDHQISRQQCSQS